jgi:hypothetical protein
MKAEAVAAFLAVGVALFVAIWHTREARQQLRREAVAEVDVRSSKWGIEAGKLVAGIRQFQAGKITADTINGELLGGLTSATADLNRSLRVAEMVCTAKNMRELADKMTATIAEFLRLVAAPPPTDADERRARLQQLSSQGPEIALKFSGEAAAFVFEGMQAYSVRSPLAAVRRAAKRVVFTKTAKR